MSNVKKLFRLGGGNGKANTSSASLGSQPATGGTQLHVAARRRNVDEIGELLAVAEGIDVNETDSKGNTALHCLLLDVCPGENCKYKAALCAELLVEAGADMRIANSEGEVPLYLAIRHEWEECAMILLHRGADTTIRLKNGKTLAQYLMAKMPYALAEVLDDSVLRGQMNEEDVLIVDFSALLQYPKRHSPTDSNNEQNDETEFLHSVLNTAERTNLYQHPVTELFMRLKYQKLQLPIAFSIILHLLTLAFYSTYIVYLYIFVCAYNDSRKNNLCVETFKKTRALAALNGSLALMAEEEPDCVEGCTKNDEVQYMSYVLGVIWLTMIGSELLVLKYRARSQVLARSSLFWFIFYVLMPITLWPSVEDDQYINTWRYPIAAAGVWFVWALCIEQLNKVPPLAVYLRMFTKVSIKIVQLALLFFPLLIGFTIGFFVLGAQNVEHWYSFLTLISLMVGQPNYNEFFTEEREEKSVVYVGVAMIMYLLFIILMCVVFINFLLGLTISDVKELWEESQRSTAKDQVRLMYLFDRLKFLRFKVFGDQDILKSKMEYILHVKNHSSYIPRTLVRKLIGLSMRANCSHHKINSPRSKLQLQSAHPKIRALVTGAGSRRQTLRSLQSHGSKRFSEDSSAMHELQHQEAMDSIRQLERQITVLTKALSINNPRSSSSIV